MLWSAHSVYMLKDPGSSAGRWCMWSWSKGAIPHLVVHIDFNKGVITNLVVHIDFE